MILIVKDFILDDLNLDIIALQEIESTSSLAELSDNLGDNWSDYRSENSNWGELSYLINTETITINNIYTILNNSEYYFAYRPPYVLNIEFNLWPWIRNMTNMEISF